MTLAVKVALNPNTTNQLLLFILLLPHQLLLLLHVQFSLMFCSLVTCLTIIIVPEMVQDVMIVE